MFEIHPWALVDREPVALDAGCRISGRRLSGEEGEWGTQFEYTEEAGIIPVEENEEGKETGESETAHDVHRPGFGFPV
jgi:hypothetical protein